MKNLVKNLIYGSMAFILVITACSDDSGTEPIDPGNNTTTKEYPTTDEMSIIANQVFDNYTYPIKIYLPATYGTNKNLPIIYILDGALNFKYVIDNLGSNSEVIVVGIGDFAAKEEWQRRFADLMPGTKCQGQGKHLDFYNFITKNLVPRIDYDYDNDHNSRTFVGHSASGIFMLVSMFLEDSENVVFHNFIASDPNLGCDPDYFAEMLHDNDFSEGAKKFKLYLALSSGGSMTEVRQFSKNIQEKEYTWLTFKYEEFLNSDHMGVVEPSFKSGLKFIFDE